MDQFDRAQALEQRQRDEAIARQQEYAQNAGVSFTHCEDCDEPIPEKRRQAVKGCTRCVGCEEIKEEREKRG